MGKNEVMECCGMFDMTVFCFVFGMTIYLSVV